MDYDTSSIPDAYDAGRDYPMADKISALAFFSNTVPVADVRKVVDLGCGTGRFSQALETVFDAEVCGVEPSAKMLDVARAKDGGRRVTFYQGHAEDIPLSTDSVDVVFLSMVLHHIKDLTLAAKECARVLCDGGHVCLRNTTFDEISSYPYLAHFPSIRGIIENELVTRTHLIETFKQVGLGVAAHTIVDDEISPNWAAYADKLALRADSFVARLPDDEFATGLEAIRAYAATQEGNQSVSLNVDLFVFQLRAS